MIFSEPTEENFLLFAARYYDNFGCSSIYEFREDVARFQVVRKNISKFIETNSINSRLIINHIMTITNVFGIDAGVRMLVFKMGEDKRSHLPILKSFLVFLNSVPDTVPELTRVKTHRKMDDILSLEIR